MLLASCEEVQAMLGVTSAQDAFDRIDYPLRDVHTYGPPLPGIIIQGLKQNAGYNGDQDGELLVSVFDRVAEQYAITEDAPLDWKNDTLAWLNRCGAIRSQMKRLSKTPLSDFNGVRFDAIRWRDHVHPQHDCDDLGDGSPPEWFRYHSFSVEWTT